MARSTTDKEAVHIECGIPGDSQESNFMNATLQSHNELEFSIHTTVSVPPYITKEGELARYLDWILNEMVEAVPSIPFWGGPKIEFDVELGLQGAGEENPLPCIEHAFIGDSSKMDFWDFAAYTIQDEEVALRIARSMLMLEDNIPYETGLSQLGPIKDG